MCTWLLTAVGSAQAFRRSSGDGLPRAGGAARGRPAQRVRSRTFRRWLIGRLTMRPAHRRWCCGPAGWPGRARRGGCQSRRTQTPAACRTPCGQTVRSLGTASANSTPNSADSTRCTTSPRPTLVLPAAIALSPLTMVEIMCSGMLALPPVESANHMVTAANTTPARIPPTAPRSSRAATCSCRRLVVAAIAITSWARGRRVRRDAGLTRGRSADPAVRWIGRQHRPPNCT
jgi:hypothetical protein